MIAVTIFGKTPGFSKKNFSIDSTNYVDLSNREYDRFVILDSDYMVMPSSTKGLVKIVRDRTRYGVITWIGLYKDFMEFGTQRDGGYCGAGIWLLNTIGHGDYAWNLLNAIAEPLQTDLRSVSQSPSNFLEHYQANHLAEVRPLIDLVQSSETRLEEGRGVSADAPTSGCFVDVTKFKNSPNISWWIDFFQAEVGLDNFGSAWLSDDPRVAEAAAVKRRLPNFSVERMETQASRVGEALNAKSDGGPGTFAGMQGAGSGELHSFADETEHASESPTGRPAAPSSRRSAEASTSDISHWSRDRDFLLERNKHIENRIAQIEKELARLNSHELNYYKPTKKPLMPWPAFFRSVVPNWRRGDMLIVGMAAALLFAASVCLVVYFVPFRNSSATNADIPIIDRIQEAGRPDKHIDTPSGKSDVHVEQTATPPRSVSCPPKTSAEVDADLQRLQSFVRDSTPLSKKGLEELRKIVQKTQLDFAASTSDK